MEIVNSLRFKDSRDKSFSDNTIKKFCEKFINNDNIKRVEVTKDNIYLHFKDSSGISHYTIYARISTSFEMVAYLSGLINADFCLKNLRG